MIYKLELFLDPSTTYHGHSQARTFATQPLVTFQTQVELGKH